MSLHAVDLFGLNITNRVSVALPIDDRLSWLVSDHPDASLKQILSMLGGGCIRRLPSLQLGRRKHTKLAGVGWTPTLKGGRHELNGFL